MAPWNWRNPCTSSASTDSDESSNQTPTPVRKRRVQQNLFPPKNAGGANSIYQNPNLNTNSEHIITPVLFSTNRGLHLRVAKCNCSMSNKACAASTGACACLDAAGEGGDRFEALNASGNANNLSNTTCDYEIHFCDLERWSTNRANTICLEDTFIVSRRNNNSNNSYSLSSPNGSSNESNGILNKRRSSSIFFVPSGSRHALVMPRRSLYQRSTSIQSTFERFGVH